MSADHAPTHTVRAITCLGCGCACDDIAITLHERRIVEAENACDLGRDWFGDGRVPERTLVNGRDSPIDEAFDAVARLLTAAARPLIYLAPDLSCEAVGEAVALADGLRAVLDSVTSATVMPSLLAAQARGGASATLGEIRNRADVVLFWAVDPSIAYPRYMSRYAPEPAGLHVPDGRRGRTVIAVDVGDHRGPLDADLRVAVPPADELDTLIALEATIATGTSAGTETAWKLARALAPELLKGRYVAIVVDSERLRGPHGPQARAEGLVALTQALNDKTRAVMSALRAGGNRSGADGVVTSQTGSPAAIDFTRGYPRYRPRDGSAAARLERHEVDASLIVGNAAAIPASVWKGLAQTRHAVIGPRASHHAPSDSVAAIDTGVAGIHSGGTAVRLDGVMLPLGQCLEGPRNATETLRALRSRCLNHPLP